MHGWVGLEVWEERRAELVREAERRRLVKELRGARKARAKGRPGDGYAEVRDRGIEVRWGLLEDEPRVADLLGLNGMPRWIASEERYIVAERDGEILAAMTYRTGPGRLVLGLLVSAPWVEERALAVALYVGAAQLAREMGVTEVIARAFPYLGDYPREAGYLRQGRQWRLDPTPYGEEPAGGRWKKLLRGGAVPFVGLLRG